MEYKKINDYELMYRVRDQDDEARDILFDKYLPLVRKYAYQYFDIVKKCGADLDDLIQEGLLAFYRGIYTYNENKNVLFYTYVSLCIKRQMITYCRNLSSEKQMVLNNAVVDYDLCNLGEEHNFIEDVLQEEFTKNKFIRYKNLFDLEYSSIFELRYNGFTYREISELLDISVSTVDGRLCKIRKYLQKKEKKIV